MAILAACGLVYEYLMAHFAGRILGSVEPTIYAMIGLMIVAMGVGAFSAKWINSIYQSFAWVELTIGLLGGISILVMSASVAFVYLLPQWILLNAGILLLFTSVFKNLTVRFRICNRFFCRYGDTSDRPYP